jgi:hypothetical protein
MQIHEIFSPKNEGILKGLATLAAGAPEKYARQTLGLEKTPYYTKGSTSAAQNPFVSKEAELRKLMGPLNTGLAQQQFKNWNAALAQYGVDNPSKLDEKTQQALKSAVIKNANKTFGVYNLLNFSRYVDPAYRQNAQAAEKNISEIIDDLMNKPGQATQQDWNNFVTNAQEASVLARMHPDSGNDPRELLNALTRATKDLETFKQTLSRKSPDQLTTQEKAELRQLKIDTAQIAIKMAEKGDLNRASPQQLQQLELDLSTQDQELDPNDAQAAKIIAIAKRAIANAKAKGTL